MRFDIYIRVPSSVGNWKATDCVAYTSFEAAAYIKYYRRFIHVTHVCAVPVGWDFSSFAKPRPLESWDENGYLG